MSLANLSSEAELEPLLAQDQELLLAFLVDGSSGSQAARNALSQAVAEHPEAHAYTVDARSVRNLAQRFQVSAVPTVVRVRGDRTLAKLVGPQSVATYAALLSVPARPANAADAGAAPKQPSVTVYVTNTCPWCRRLESYLDSHGIRYRAVNVERDAEAGREMTRRSGQMGVPQADIGGRWVVGFDKQRIDKLLGLTKGS